MRRMGSSAAYRASRHSASTPCLSLVSSGANPRFHAASNCCPAQVSYRSFGSKESSSTTSSRAQTQSHSASSSSSASPPSDTAETEQDIMTSKLIPSNPSDVMVIRNITPNIATFSVPFARFGSAKIGGRGTLVKLSSGALAVFSPVALTDGTKAKIAEMGGQVGYIVALDIEHHIFISEWAKAYPDAKIIGPEGLPEKRAKQKDEKIGQEKFSVVFTKENKRQTKISDEFDADFDYEYADGHGNRELVFFYRPDKTMIEADLLFNLPANEQYSRAPKDEKETTGFASKIFNNVQSPEGDAKWMQRFTWYLAVKDRTSFNESVQTMSQWDFKTIIPCHGDVIEGNGKEIFLKVFEWHLKGSKN